LINNTNTNNCNDDDDDNNNNNNNKTLKYKDVTIEIQRIKNVKEGDTSNNRGDWDYFRVI
jgi:hypothetical protein